MLLNMKRTNSRRDGIQSCVEPQHSKFTPGGIHAAKTNDQLIHR
jgi:hypothetical protein